ncbi:hypothetical protein G9F72_014060 [Clostridium estertheticum]|uniref:AraC family transcriptional regulator n=1 Tax=Clostridium estertheticum TaxID=238834 RepID=UPI0013E8F98F|nr:AraC family transcriptional regulator [Clostridium estertheticum]MBZ9687451.1 hypothetical protein [Clostridium estertheticum]
MSEENILNILNGQVMFDYFKQNHFDKNGVYVPFNEAMCVGEAQPDIFSNQFNACRCEAHHVTIEQYNQLTLKPLQTLFKNQFTRIFLWFDDDMFCQINLLTILAYLDQLNYKNKITFNLVNREFKIIDCFEFGVQGYDEIYKQVIINRCMPENINLSIMKNGIRLYLEYLKEENEITTYIKQHEDLQFNSLLTDLLITFPEYGLGDTQYIQLIKMNRN